MNEKEFKKPEISVLVESNNGRAYEGRECCDSYDWSGCCYNG